VRLKELERHEGKTKGRKMRYRRGGGGSAFQGNGRPKNGKKKSRHLFEPGGGKKVGQGPKLGRRKIP